MRLVVREWCRVGRYIGPTLPMLDVARFAVAVRQCSDLDKCRRVIQRVTELSLG